MTRRCGLAAMMLCATVSGQDSGVDLLHRMQTALGGADRIAAVRDFEQSVEAQTWNGAGQRLGKVRKRARWVKSSCLRLDQSGPYDTYVLYFDGRSGWEIAPDGHFADLAGGELEFARKYFSDFVLNIWLADRIAGYTVTSPAPNVVRVAVHNRASEQIDITLDPGSWLPLKESSVSLADPSHPVPSETRIEEWTTVEGVRFPSRTVALHNGARLAEIRSERIEVNQGLTCSGLSKKPGDNKPQITRE